MSSRRNPFREIERMFDRMSRQFEEMPWGFEGEAGGQALWGRSPSLDLAEHDEEYVVTVDLPGFERDDISVQLSGRTLQISADRSEGSEQREENYLQQERSQRSVSRSITIPDRVDEEGVSATYNNGVLTVTLPKSEPSDRGRQIDVE
ncbi:archaeal heat shock protein Hsp14 [Halegenticoccus tardaugens]|uniref:archaeal heat shock protein Hsp14 n=1 Tax=Halegenticoccus tardaugens TaxID=2071624 RepID=UPI00100A9B23|nr:archaeal heat shock protein Hsp14 [Halegenticoccus tardaugens]